MKAVSKWAPKCMNVNKLDLKRSASSAMCWGGGGGHCND